jgi:hypothetical protein
MPKWHGCHEDRRFPWESTTGFIPSIYLFLIEKK